MSALLAGAALGQTYENLHDSDTVYGLDRSAFSTPWTNSDVLTLLGFGETDSELYPDVSFTAYGIFTGASLTNQAAIDVNGVGGNAYGSESDADANVDAHGIFSEAERNVEVTNSGNISVAGWGGYAESASGSARAYADVSGISANLTLTNSGTILASATGGAATATGAMGITNVYGRAYGLNADADVINTGDVSVFAAGGTGTVTTAESYYASAQAQGQGFGISAHDGVDNTGTIAVRAVGGTAESAYSYAYADAIAYGIFNSYGTVHNAGDITVEATGGVMNSESGSATAGAFGIQTYGNVDNSGDITVTAETQGDEFAGAYGIYMAGGEGDSNLTNTGTIRAFGDTAYELYIAAGTTRIVDTYNVTLDGEPNQPSIYVANGATLNLNNALLTVTDVQGDVAGATQWDTPYRLFSVAGEGAVSGNFGDVEPVNPDVTAIYYTNSTPNAADDSVALSYAPQASEALASSSVEERVIAMGPYALNQHMTMDLMYETLALEELDEGTDDSTGDTAQSLSACQRSGGAFFQPNYSFIEKDNDPLGYEAGMSGVSGGYSQCVNDSLLGLHVGYGKANINYTGAGYSSNTEDQEVVTTGFSGMTRFRPWIFRYGFTGFRGWHDYHGLTGLGLTETETAEFDSYGGTGLLMVGRTFKHNRHVFLPEIGANWLWVHRE
ncbi:MAG: hypothetical protein ABFE01_08130, partial [Phycisphaerales bacterium]